MYLLDTCTLLWVAADDNNLSHEVRDIINKSSKIYYCPLSFAEIEIALKKERIILKATFAEFVQNVEKKFSAINFDGNSALQFYMLETHHKDPFDRMLISIAKANNLTFLSPDEIIRKYNIKVIW